MVIDELIPKLKEDYMLSDKPEDRAIAGASSGAICAFTVAGIGRMLWQGHLHDRFTNIRGGHVYRN